MSESKVDTEIICGIDADDEFINIRLDNGELIQINKKVAERSQLIKNILEADQSATEILAGRFSLQVNKDIFKFLNHLHSSGATVNIKKPLESPDITKVVAADLLPFINHEINYLIDLINAANYYNIEEYIELLAAKLASLMMHKTPDEIRSTFGLENDLTEEDVEEIKKLNVWDES